MRGYLAKPDRKTSGSADLDAQGRTATQSDANGRTGAEPASSVSKSGSLQQLRSALDQSPPVRSQVALQRALDQRAAAPVKAKKGKPSLQRKGIAINDDAGLESEADVMGQRASHTNVFQRKQSPKLGTSTGQGGGIAQRKPFLNIGDDKFDLGEAHWTVRTLEDLKLQASYQQWDIIDQRINELKRDGKAPDEKSSPGIQEKLGRTLLHGKKLLEHGVSTAGEGETQGMLTTAEDVKAVAADASKAATKASASFVVNLLTGGISGKIEAAMAVAKSGISAAQIDDILTEAAKAMSHDQKATETVAPPDFVGALETIRDAEIEAAGGKAVGAFIPGVAFLVDENNKEAVQHARTTIQIYASDGLPLAQRAARLMGLKDFSLKSKSKYGTFT
jgi:hypothetical protein